MSVFNLNEIFRPERVAVVGASDDPKSVGGAVFRNMRASFPGDVYAVNLKRREVDGVRAYPSVKELPEKPDLVVVCTPASSVASVIEQSGEAGIRGVIVNSAGFAEIGESGRALQEEVRATTRRFEGLRVIGPNCLGVIFPRTGLNASFAREMPRDGRVAFISQSGAVCAAILDWAEEEKIGFSCFVSVGNMVDVDFGDLIDYLAADTKTEALILYVESIKDARKFLSASRAFTRTKPIIAYKAGRFPESAQAAASHTGALAGADAVYDAAFERAGIVRIDDSKAMFDCAELLAQKRIPRHERLAIVTNAGGPGVMATDSLMANNGRLAQFKDASMKRLNEALPKYWSHGNPVDVLGDATPERYAEATRIVLDDEGVDALLAVFTPQAMTDPKATAAGLLEAASSGAKPVLGSWMGGASVREAIELLNASGIPTYSTPEQAVRAFMYLVSFAKRREILYETPRDVRVDLRDDRKKKASEVIGGADTKRFLSEADSKALLQAYGLSVTEIVPAATAQDAVAAAREIGFPVVLKLDSPDITHKTDVGGVALALRSEADVNRAFDTILESAARRRPDAHVAGVTVQRMVTGAEAGYEVILGAKKDPTFGAAILVGMGGVATELYRDRAIGLPPLNERLARRMLESLRSWPLLAGYRGRPGVDVDALVGAIIRLSYLVAELPQVRELDVNPLLATSEGAVALDARVMLDELEPAAAIDDGKPFSHLAIHPYPNVYEKPTALPDGTPVFLRPIRPEDEPMWLDFIDSTSQESVFQRFRQLVRRSHELASRFCFIDYDREMAIVAEMSDGDERRLVGVGRLVADPDHELAEYAVLVADAWQGRGLGGLLTDHCLELARPWGVEEIVAYTSLGNTRTMKLFRRRGFRITKRDGWGEVELRLTVKGLKGEAQSPKS